MNEYILVMIDKGEAIYVSSGNKEQIETLIETLKQNTTKQYAFVEVESEDELLTLRNNSIKLKEKFKHLINKTL